MSKPRGPYGRPIAERFWRFVTPGRPDECWLWTGFRAREGYGSLMTEKPGGKRTVLRANRISWEIHHGPIPAGLVVCHRCDNPPCCNPAHLFLGTVGDNNRDAFAKGRRLPVQGPRGEAHPNAKLTMAAAREIRALAPATPVPELARRFGVRKTSILKVIKGRTWKEPN